MADHFSEIGVGAIWMSPIFKSPMTDFGYDISDFRNIDSTYGTMDDFLSLRKKLKSLGKYIRFDFRRIDEIYHTNKPGLYTL